MMARLDHPGPVAASRLDPSHQPHWIQLTRCRRWLRCWNGGRGDVRTQGLQHAVATWPCHVGRLEPLESTASQGISWNFLFKHLLWFNIAWLLNNLGTCRNRSIKWIQMTHVIDMAYGNASPHHLPFCLWDELGWTNCLGLTVKSCGLAHRRSFGKQKPVRTAKIWNIRWEDFNASTSYVKHGLFQQRLTLNDVRNQNETQIQLSSFIDQDWWPWWPMSILLLDVSLSDLTLVTTCLHISLRPAHRHTMPHKGKAEVDGTVYSITLSLSSQIRNWKKQTRKNNICIRHISQVKNPCPRECSLAPASQMPGPWASLGTGSGSLWVLLLWGRIKGWCPSPDGTSYCTRSTTRAGGRCWRGGVNRCQFVDVKAVLRRFSQDAFWLACFGMFLVFLVHFTPFVLVCVMIVMLDVETGRRICVYFVLGLWRALQKGFVGSAWKCISFRRNELDRRCRQAKRWWALVSLSWNTHEQTRTNTITQQPPCLAQAERSRMNCQSQGRSWRSFQWPMKWRFPALLLGFRIS